MKNRTLIVAALVMVLLCVGLIFLGLRHENAGGGSPGQSQTTDGDTQSQAQQDITATLAVCGDIMSHLPQTNDAYDAATDTYSYLPCFQYAKAWTESADYTVGNLETTLNGPPYSGYPQFCAPDALAYNLKSIGFDLVTTANNHCMDKGYNGLSRTLDVLDQAELKHVGTYRTQAEFDENHGVVVADVILGSHSHVPQPMGTRTVTLDDGSTRTGFVAYSLGNFVSNQSPATVNVNYTDTTAILRLELTKNGQTQETTVTDVSYVPMLVLNRGTGVQDQYLILDVNALIAAHDSGDTSVATDAVYSKLEYALNGCHTILGADYDKAGTPPQTTSA